ncbi:hypothetical protein [Pyxidicoccus xibeiensis]|uniref:hypothetical protein n=1 Tax=Pyxidicoccus xibeiensis TaxID=2906759 RepID=UPI0020A7CD73|nr:hypothetical protein [Pyxidicoccus xibeiensis]MCP3136247.1 hypothetical protein [Pyxidicoccus xibeiensis]
MFLESLRDGRFGVRLHLGEGFQLKSEDETRAELKRTTDDTSWVLSLNPMRLGLRPEHDPVLRSDVEHQLRVSFQDQYDALATRAGPDRSPPRTDDPRWSPLIELDRTLVDGAPVLRVLGRLAYEPGLEVLEARLLVPLAVGTFQVQIRHFARETGGREAALHLLARRKEPGRSPDEIMEHQRQQDFDDPAWDASFPEHGLSVLRAALAWLTTPERGVLRVLEPLPLPPEGEVILPDLGCAVTPPPRYTLTPSQDMGLGRNIAMFTRLTCGDLRTMDVWRDAAVLPPGPGRAEALVDGARRNAESWAKEGVTDIEVDTQVLPEVDGRPHVSSHVRFVVQGQPMVAATRWLADVDGAVFRITVGGPRDLTYEEFSAEADAILRSWRRLPGEAARPVQARADAPAAPGKKPWWKLW